MKVAGVGNFLGDREKCAYRGCRENATHALRIVIKAKGSEVEAVAEVGLRVCNDHATQENADEVLANPLGQRQIEHGFSNAGKAPPDWPRCRAYWYRFVPAEPREGGR